MNSTLLELRGLCKTYEIGKNRVEVLSGINLELEAATTTALVGASGAGKSTLLHLLGALDRPTSGTVCFRGDDIFRKNDRELATFRNRSIGFVFQFHHLLPEFTALENVAIPLAIRGESTAVAKERAAQMLAEVGLSHRVTHKPGELSGGERQRVAVARALVTQPACVLADEPTGNLDRGTADQVFDLIMTLNAKFNTALVMVTHDPSLAAKMRRKLTISDGVLRE